MPATERAIRAKQRRKDNPELMEKQVARIKKRKRNNPEYVVDMRKRSFKRKYSLSYEDWLKLWEIQDGRCAICEKSFTEPSEACVDHNHKTGKVRSLLCHNCNMGMGLFKDDPRILIKVAEYLLKG